MKRFFCLIVSLFMIIALTGCNVYPNDGITPGVTVTPFNNGYNNRADDNQNTNNNRARNNNGMNKNDLVTP